MADKGTIMVLKVDLHCPSCYKKIKKVLAKFHQIQAQDYDEKQNTVTINVVCCNPQKFRDKLCCKGEKIIESIEIKEPPKLKDTGNKTKPESEITKGKPKDTQKPTSTPAPTPALGVPIHLPAHGWPQVFCPVPVCCGTCYGCNRAGPCYQVCCGSCHGCNRGGPCYQRHQRPTCCGQCHEGNPGGPCHRGDRRRECCEQCSEGIPGGPCYRRPVPCYEGYGGSRLEYYGSRCDEYSNEENTSGWTIM